MRAVKQMINEKNSPYSRNDFTSNAFIRFITFKTMWLRSILADTIDFAERVNIV